MREQLWHTHRSMVSTVLMNPMWNIGRASSRCPKWPGHSAMPPWHVAHLVLRSMVPSRGSLNPPARGLPRSYKSLLSIWHTDIRLWRAEGVNLIKRWTNDWWVESSTAFGHGLDYDNHSCLMPLPPRNGLSLRGEQHKQECATVQRLATVFLHDSISRFGEWISGSKPNKFTRSSAKN